MKQVFATFLIAFLLFSCKGNSQDKQKDKRSAEIADQLVKMNQARLQAEMQKINEFIQKHNFNVTTTGSGLRYEIYQKGAGVKPDTMKTVGIKFKVYLLDGTLCYSSDTVVTLFLGRNEQVRGLEEGLSFMAPGDKAHIILPAHLAYGMSGDGNKIGPGKALYYDLELVNASK